MTLPIFCQSKALLQEISIAHSRKGSTRVALKIPFRAFLLTCHWVMSGRQLNGVAMVGSWSLAVYQSTSVSPPLNTSAAWDHWASGWTTFLEMQTWNGVFPPFLFWSINHYTSLRKKCLAQWEGWKINDFSGIFRAMWCSGFYSCLKRKFSVMTCVTLF